MASFTLTTGEKNDDYETPEEAFELLLPYIDTSNVIYEPFYCEGKAKEFLNNIGYKNVIHENEDFYVNWEHYKFDVIITNPPYSCKVHVFKELYKIGKPFALLVPVSTISKLFLKKIFGNDLHKIQLIIPNKRIHFIKNGIQSNRNWFDTVFLCYKLNLDKDITFC